MNVNDLDIASLLSFSTTKHLEPAVKVTGGRKALITAQHKDPYLAELTEEAALGADGSRSYTHCYQTLDPSSPFQEQVGNHKSVDHAKPVSTAADPIKSLKQVLEPCWGLKHK